MIFSVFRGPANRARPHRPKSGRRLLKGPRLAVFQTGLACGNVSTFISTGTNPGLKLLRF